MASLVQTKDTVVTSESVILFTTIQVRDIPLTLIEECSDKKKRTHHLLQQESYTMVYSRTNRVQEQQEACKKAEQITTACEQLHITLDPISWSQDGMQAQVKINNIQIGSLLELSQRQQDDILRQIQIKLFENAALKSIHAQPNMKAVMWSPVDILQPQVFLNLWIVTLETEERIPIIELIRQGQRVYEPFTLDKNDKNQIASLFGPAAEGAYRLGETITIKERDRQYTGEVIYVLPPGKAFPGRKNASRGYHTVAGTTYTNDVAARYIVDCGDGFPHIVHQSQVVN
jgi:hypothetical protein